MACFILGLLTRSRFPAPLQEVPGVVDLLGGLLGLSSGRTPAARYKLRICLLSWVPLITASCSIKVIESGETIKVQNKEKFNGRMDGWWKGGWMVNWTDGQMPGWMDRMMG